MTRKEDQQFENESRELIDQVISGSIQADEFQQHEGRLKSDLEASQSYLDGVGDRVDVTWQAKTA